MYKMITMLYFSAMAFIIGWMMSRRALADNNLAKYIA